MQNLCRVSLTLCWESVETGQLRAGALPDSLAPSRSPIPSRVLALDFQAVTHSTLAARYL
jgi:hypothetical protein